MREVSSELAERAGRVRLVLMDADGVLTDGRIYMGSNGYDGRSFHTRDGQGIRLGQRGGLLFGIVSGREAKVVSERAEELYITEVHQGVYDKSGRVDEILQRLKLTDEVVCFIGDDLTDVPVMRRVGLAAAPADAAPEVREIAHFVTECPGGRGAVREVVDLLLHAADKWKQVTERYYK
jgi:3-deoxy-D-manno-octulosonate 8-phosphate phosphatase (KDO 8-P phosphatase)